MKHHAIALSVLMVLGVSRTAPIAQGVDLFDVGTNRQLLIDEAFFEEVENVRIRLHPARKTGEKVVQREHPWEAATLNWFSVMKDPGVVDRQARYRMWYECYDVEGWPTGDDTSFCYAESRDGVHWTKPKLGLFELPGEHRRTTSCFGRSALRRPILASTERASSRIPQRRRRHATRPSPRASGEAAESRPIELPECSPPTVCVGPVTQIRSAMCSPTASIPVSGTRDLARICDIRAGRRSRAGPGPIGQAQISAISTR